MRKLASTLGETCLQGFIISCGVPFASFQRHPRHVMMSHEDYLRLLNVSQKSVMLPEQAISEVSQSETRLN